MTRDGCNAKEFQEQDVEGGKKFIFFVSRGKNFHNCIPWSNKNGQPSIFHCNRWPICIIFDTQYTEATHNTTVILHLYCCYTTLGKFGLPNNDFIDWSYPLPLHKLKTIQFSMSLSYSWDQILQQLFIIASSFTHTRLQSDIPFSQWHRFMTSHSKCQASTVSGQPHLQLASNTHDSTIHALYLVFNKTKIRANCRS